MNATDLKNASEIEVGQFLTVIAAKKHQEENPEASEFNPNAFEMSQLHKLFIIGGRQNERRVEQVGHVLEVLSIQIPFMVVANHTLITWCNENACLSQAGKYKHVVVDVRQFDFIELQPAFAEAAIGKKLADFQVIKEPVQKTA